MKAFVSYSNSGFSLYSRESLLKRMGGSVFTLRLTDADHVFVEGTATECLDHIERSGEWGKWLVTEQNTPQVLGIAFEPRTFILTIKEIL